MSTQRANNYNSSGSSINPGQNTYGQYTIPINQPIPVKAQYAPAASPITRKVRKYSRRRKSRRK